MTEITIDFDRPVIAIKLINEKEYVESFEKRGESIPPFLVFARLVKIKGEK